MQALFLSAGTNAEGIGNLIVPHMRLVRPPTQYDKRGNVIAQYPIGTVRNPERADERIYTFSQVHIEVAPVVSGDMSWLHTLSGDRGYQADKPSSVWHHVLHKNTGKLGKIVAVAPNEEPEEKIKAEWPNCPLMAGLTEYLNDSTNDVQDLLLEPELEEVIVQPVASAGESARQARFTANAGANTAARQRATKAAAKKEWRWKQPELRSGKGDLKDMASVRSSVDSTQAGWRKRKTKTWRLMFLPNVPPFASKHLDEALDGNPDLAAFFTLCVLHEDMRVTALITDELESVPRTLLEATSVPAATMTAITEFNRVMKDDLKIRHALAKTVKGDVPSSGFDGRSARRLIDDFAINPELQGLISFRRTGQYPSKYFRALYVLIATVQPNAAILKGLPELADCVRHYAKASQIHRKPVPLMSDYPDYNFHCKWFAAKWRALGHPLRGYGFHCWCTPPPTPPPTIPRPSRPPLLLPSSPPPPSVHLPLTPPQGNECRAAAQVWVALDLRPVRCGGQQ